MKTIPAELAAAIARTFHGIELAPAEAAAIAKALEPVEAASEAYVAGNLTFESEPSHYDRLLRAAR